MTADDTYTVQFETADGATGLLHSSCATGGQFVVATKVTGTAGSAWTQGDEVWVDTGAGPTQVAGRRRPARGRAGAAAGRAAAHHLRHVALHRHGPRALHAPLRRSCATGSSGTTYPTIPVAGTFADGVANQAVVDAIRKSSATRAWVDVPR